MRNGAELCLDTWSGFVRDPVTERQYELSALPIRATEAGLLARLPFWCERLNEKFFGPLPEAVRGRPWGTYLREVGNQFYDEVASFRSARPIWIHGHWQSERYFDWCRPEIAAELQPPRPEDARFLELGALIESTNSIAVGVRLYEEIPDSSKILVGGVTDLEFYSSAGSKLAEEVESPVFFVFSTRMSSKLQSVQLPGPVHYITADLGFEDAISTLWLASQCKHHVISNSSFYWWGAWLAEMRRPDTRVIACNRFSNDATIPTRWEAWSAAR